MKPEQKSLYLFDENNSLRLFCFKAVRSSKYEWFIILFIVLTSVHLSLSRPTSDPEGYEVRTLYWVDFATTMVFASEFLMKIIAFGFIGCGPQSYLRNPWNLFDFFILVVSLTSINPLINRLQVIKMFRVMRVLRLVSSTYGLRVGLQAIMSAIPSVISVVLIMLLFFIIFGVIGVSFFKGKYYYCWQERAMDMNGYDEVFHLETKWDCFNSGGDWRREYYNFDNIYEAMSTLFIMANLSWSNVMY